jgi:hypothetical protein
MKFGTNFGTFTWMQVKEIKLSLTPIHFNPNGLYYQQCQLDVQLHQDGQGHKLESVEGLNRLKGWSMRD